MQEKLKYILNQINASVSVYHYTDHKLYLEELYRQLKSRVKIQNKTQVKRDSRILVSYIKFSSLVGLGETNVSRLIIFGLRPLSIKNAEKIALHQNLNRNEKKYFLSLVKFQHSKSASERDKAFKTMIELKNKQLKNKLDKRLLKYFTHWKHAIIREIIESTETGCTATEVKSILVYDLRVDEINQSLELLENLNFIYSERGRFFGKNENVFTGREVEDHAVIHFHSQMIEMAKLSMHATSDTLSLIHI